MSRRLQNEDFKTEADITGAGGNANQLLNDTKIYLSTKLKRLDTALTDGTIAAFPTTTKGDLIVHNGTTNIRLGVGTNGQVLTADSAEISGVKWAASSGGSTNLSVATKTTAYTLTSSDDVILADASSAAFTLTLPAAASNSGKVFRIDKVDSSDNVVTIDANASETINGNLTRILARQRDNLNIVSDGSNWHVLSGFTTSEIYLYTGNGHGSTNNKIRRYTTVAINIGSGMTLTQSSTDGDSITINEDGVYGIEISDRNSAGDVRIGISNNSNQLTTSIESISASHFIVQIADSNISYQKTVSVNIALKKNDVIRPHTNGAVDGASAATSNFRITKLS